MKSLTVLSVPAAICFIGAALTYTLNNVDLAAPIILLILGLIFLVLSGFGIYKAFKDCHDGHCHKE